MVCAVLFYVQFKREQVDMTLLKMVLILCQSSNTWPTSSSGLPKTRRILMPRCSQPRRLVRFALLCHNNSCHMSVILYCHILKSDSSRQYETTSDSQSGEPVDPMSSAFQPNAIPLRQTGSHFVQKRLTESLYLTSQPRKLYQGETQVQPTSISQLFTVHGTRHFRFEESLKELKLNELGSQKVE